MVGDAERAACGRLNRLRTRLILDAVKGFAPGEPLTADVWFETVAGRTAEWEIPFIPLERLGIRRELDSGWWQTETLVPMKSGQEVYPFHDREHGVVYKFFDLKGRASVGKKLRYERLSEHEFDLIHGLASLPETLEKICVLHDAGALPTEIAGVADSGDCLIVKQPLALARPYSGGFTGEGSEMLFEQERREAIAAICGILCPCPGLRQTTAVITLDDRPWFVGDLHERKIMLDADGRPTIIDALTSAVPHEAIVALPLLAEAASRAKVWRETGVLPERRDFDDGDDSQL